MPDTIRVVSAIADKANLTLYKEDGTHIIIPNGDYRVKALLDQIIPITARGEVAVVSLETFSAYAAFEQRTNGFVRFFKIAKDKVKHIFGLDTSEPTVPTPVMSEPKIVTKPMTSAQIIEQAEVMGTSDDIEKHQTVIAVVKNGDDHHVIPQAESLREQVIHATKTERTIGMENLLKRLGGMIDQRGHSVEDLLRFLQRGDLPVADDGSIIAYKILRKTPEEGVYVDCHTGRVKQAVGSFVCVDEAMVDKNRRNECSNGLHVARRGYIGNFSGDVCTLIKVAPEDVITVPHNDANKVRVCGYHILGVLDQESYAKLRSNAPMTGNFKAAEMLARAMSGKHVARLEEVKIHGQSGTNVVVTKLNSDSSRREVDLEQVNKDEQKKARAFDDHNGAVGGIDPKQINKQIAEEDAKVEEESLAALEKEMALPVKPEPVTPKPGSLSNKQQAQLYYSQMIDENHTLDFRRKAAQNLKDVKKRAKKPYGDFGLHEVTILGWFEKLAQEPVDEPKTTETVLNPPTEEGLAIIKQALSEKTMEPPKNLSSTKLTNKEIAGQLFELRDWEGLQALKKRTKKSWSEWFSSDEVDTILNELSKK